MKTNMKTIKEMILKEIMMNNKIILCLVAVLLLMPGVLAYMRMSEHKNNSGGI